MSSNNGKSGAGKNRWRPWRLFEGLLGAHKAGNPSKPIETDLEKALSHPDAEVRRSAAQALIKLKGPEAFPVLRKALKNETDRHLKFILAFISVYDLAQTQTFSEGGVEDLLSRPRLERALTNSDPKVRRLAIMALAELRDDPAATLALQRAFENENDTSIKFFLASILVFRPAPLIGVSRSDLERELTSPDPNVRLTAIVALAQSEAPASCTTL